MIPARYRTAYHCLLAHERLVELTFPLVEQGHDGPLDDLPEMRRRAMRVQRCHVLVLLIQQEEVDVLARPIGVVEQTARLLLPDARRHRLQGRLHLIALARRDVVLRHQDNHTHLPSIGGLKGSKIDARWRQARAQPARPGKMGSSFSTSITPRYPTSR